MKESAGLESRNSLRYALPALFFSFFFLFADHARGAIPRAISPGRDRDPRCRRRLKARKEKLRAGNCHFSNIENRRVVPRLRANFTRETAKGWILFSARSTASPGVRAGGEYTFVRVCIRAAASCRSKSDATTLLRRGTGARNTSDCARTVPR